MDNNAIDPISLRDEIIRLQSRLLFLRGDRLTLKLSRNDTGQWTAVKSDSSTDLIEIENLIVRIAELKKKCYGE